MALIVISGPSGAGKSSLFKALLQRKIEHLKASISHTTRNKRPGEQEGVDYYFISRDEFFQMLREEQFLEHTEYSGNFYATSKKFVSNALASSESILFDLDHRGAMAMKTHSATLIFCAPPSLEDLEKRLHKRGDAQEEIEKRMAKAQEQMRQKVLYEHIIVNDNLERASEELFQLVESITKKQHLL